MTTYRIWDIAKNYWHAQIMPNAPSENRKKILEFATFENAVARIADDKLAGALIWKLEGVPMIQMQRVKE